jgi:hypothetical protein
MNTFMTAEGPATTTPQSETATWIRANSPLVNRALRESHALGRAHKLITWMEYEASMRLKERNNTHTWNRKSEGGIPS